MVAVHEMEFFSAVLDTKPVFIDCMASQGGGVCFLSRSSLPSSYASVSHAV